MVARLVSQQSPSSAKGLEDSCLPWNPEDGTDELASENEGKQTRS